MDPGGASHPAENVILPSIADTMKTGTSLLASRCVDQPAGGPFAIVCVTTATTATMDEELEKCLDEDNCVFVYLLIYLLNYLYIYHVRGGGV
jgi:hypothetical protein